MNDEGEFLYVIVDSTGQCAALKDGGTEPIAGLPALLSDGWRPVRETPFSGTDLPLAYVLVLLERDARDPRGFGFRA